MDWVIGMENKTVWVARGENSEIIAIAASDREAALRWFKRTISV